VGQGGGKELSKLEEALAQLPKVIDGMLSPEAKRQKGQTQA
jgi:hypothetical protein